MAGEAGVRAATPEVAFTASRPFAGWLAEQRLSLVFIPYQAGKLFLIGLRAAYDLVLAMKHVDGIKAEPACPAE